MKLLQIYQKLIDLMEQIYLIWYLWQQWIIHLRDYELIL